MGRIKSVSTKALKYGPQAAIVWKYAAAPVTAAAHRTFAAQANRRTALKHADTVIEGAILMVMNEGETHWVVFSGGKPIAALPEVLAPARGPDLRRQPLEEDDARPVPEPPGRGFAPAEGARGGASDDRAAAQSA